LSLRHGLLGLLSYESMTGYDLTKEFNDSLGHFWQAKSSQIYRELDAMEQNGWLSSKRVIQDDKPNKRVYSLTDAGKSELHAWLFSMNKLENYPKMRSAVLMRIFFGGEIDNAQTLELFHKYRDATVEYIQRMESIVKAFEAGEFDDYAGDPQKAKYWMLTAMYGEIMNKASLEWIDKALTILEEGTQ